MVLFEILWINPFLAVVVDVDVVVVVVVDLPEKGSELWRFLLNHKISSIGCFSRLSEIALPVHTKWFLLCFVS